MKRFRGSNLEFLGPTRQTLLITVKTYGEATTEQLAQETYLSPGAVRQHLLALESQGLLSHFRVREGPGRPRHVFRLTDRGEGLFPQLYAALANLVLAAVEDEDDAVVERVFQRLLKAQVDLAEEALAFNTYPERIAALFHLVERWGYFPGLNDGDDDSTTLTLRHCPLASIAARHPTVCHVEAEAMRNVLPEAEVERFAHRLAGDPVCAYRIVDASIAEEVA